MRRDLSQESMGEMQVAPAATINDVAKMAGVSIKTVSRVVNREPNVRDNTRKLVMEAISALNYKPSLAARGLAGGRSFLIGLVYDNPSDSFLVDLQRGILSACRERHYGLALCPSSKSSDQMADLLEWIKSTQPDGIILTPPLSDNQLLVEKLIEVGVKFVSVSSAGTGLGPAVYIDEVEAAQAMTDHLITSGHRRIGFVRGPSDHACSALRYQGYCQALAGAGVPFDPSCVVDGQFDFASGVAAGKELLEAGSRPSAVFASNDDMASGVMHVAYKLGLSIPGDLAVAGFDDTPMSRRFWPGLSTVKQPIRQIGRRATELLMAQVSNDKVEGNNEQSNGSDMTGNDILPYELMLRASTAAKSPE